MRILRIGPKLLFQVFFFIFNHSLKFSSNRWLPLKLNSLVFLKPAIVPHYLSFNRLYTTSYNGNYDLNSGTVNNDYDYLKELILESLTLTSQKENVMSMPYICPSSNVTQSSTFSNTSYLYFKPNKSNNLTQYELQVSNDIKYMNDLIEVDGIEEYSNIIQQWSSSLVYELCEPKVCFDKISIVSVTNNKDIINNKRVTVQVPWNITFIPESVQSLYNLRLLPGIETSFFNILDQEKIKTSFSWIKLKIFFERLIFTGKLILPHAVIQGVNEFQFVEEMQQLVIVDNNFDSNSFSNNNNTNNDETQVIIANDTDIPFTSEISVIEEVTSNIPNDTMNLNANVTGSEFIRFMNDKNISKNQINNNDNNNRNALSDNNNSNGRKLIIRSNRIIWTLTSIKERLHLIRSIDNKILQNRVLATHLLEFLDSQKPRNLGLQKWNDIILDRIEPAKNIPGFKPLDIDGMEANDQNANLEKVNTILFYSTSIVLFFGVAFSIGMLNRIFFNDGHSF